MMLFHHQHFFSRSRPTNSCYDTYFIFTCSQFFYRLSLRSFENYVIWPSELQKLESVYIVWIGAHLMCVSRNNSSDIGFHDE